MYEVLFFKYRRPFMQSGYMLYCEKVELSMNLLTKIFKNVQVNVQLQKCSSLEFSSIGHVSIFENCAGWSSFATLDRQKETSYQDKIFFI